MNNRSAHDNSLIRVSQRSPETANGIRIAFQRIILVSTFLLMRTSASIGGARGGIIGMSYYEQLSTLIHDLRNPLNTISVNAELARLQLQKSQDPEAVMQCLNKIINECQKCSQVLTDVSHPPDDNDTNE